MVSYAPMAPPYLQGAEGGILQWASDLGKPYGNLLGWWMTRLSGRDGPTRNCCVIRHDAGSGTWFESAHGTH